MDVELQNFLNEGMESLESIEQDLIALEKNKYDDEIINRIFRNIHSIKGASGFFDIKKFESLSHVMETLLTDIRGNKCEVSQEVINVLLETTDILQKMMEDENLGRDFDISDISDKLNHFVFNPVHTDGAAEDKQDQDSPWGLDEKDIAVAWQNKENLGDFYAIFFDLKAVADKKDFAEGLSSSFSSIGKIRHSSVPLEELENSTKDFLVLFFETLLKSSHISEHFDIPQENILRLEEKKSVSSYMIPPPRVVDKTRGETIKKAPPPPPEKAKDKEQPLRKAPGPSEGKEAKKKPREQRQTEEPAAQTIRIGVDVLDKMLELVGEVVLGRNQFMSKFENDPAFASFAQGITKLHEHVIKTRMQPIGAIFDKFKRIVRDLAQKLDKKIELHIEGSDIELDRTLLEAFSDPLTHLIRNSVGHGIETPEERAATGKSMTGNVYLRAYHESGQIIIEVEDDGCGIDSARVKEKAIEKGLISEEDAGKLKQNEIIQFIFEPGFSTKDEADDLAGRGVGMDVVRRSLEKIGCVVDVSSIPGKGLLISASIPLTQAIVNSSIISGLTIRLGDFKLALPQLAVSELIKVTQEDHTKLIERVKGEDVFKLRGRLIPLVYLEDILDIPRTYIDDSGNVGDNKRERLSERRHPEQDVPEEIKLRRIGKERRRSNLVFIVLQHKHNYFGVLIDEVLGVEEIVVKRLPFSIKHRKVFAGTTILGSGEVSLILDINGMVEKGGMDFAKQHDQAGALFDHKKSNIEKEQVVIFSNAESEFFGVPLSLVSEIERVKPEDITKVGNKEFIKVHGESLPLLRLENHLDVTAPDRANKKQLVIIPSRVHYPMGIVASKITDTRDMEEEINIKEGNKKGIMGTFFHGDQLVFVLDVYSLLKNAAPEQYTDTFGEELQSRRILLAEDQVFFRELISQYLVERGINLTIAIDGIEALALLRKNPKKFDMVISDINMPKMDGYELVTNIKSDYEIQHLPVMALTSLTGEEHIKKGKAAGFDAYEIKIDKDRVLTCIKRLLGKKESE